MTHPWSQVSLDGQRTSSAAVMILDVVYGDRLLDLTASLRPRATSHLSLVSPGSFTSSPLVVITLVV